MKGFHGQISYNSSIDDYISESFSYLKKKISTKFRLFLAALNPWVQKNSWSSFGSTEKSPKCRSVTDNHDLKIFFFSEFLESSKHIELLNHHLIFVFSVAHDEGTNSRSHAWIYSEDHDQLCYGIPYTQRNGQVSNSGQLRLRKHSVAQINYVLIFIILSCKSKGKIKLIDIWKALQIYTERKNNLCAWLTQKLFLNWSVIDREKVWQRTNWQAWFTIC